VKETAGLTEYRLTRELTRLSYMFYSVEYMGRPTLGDKLELIALSSVANLQTQAYGSEIRQLVNSLRGYDYSVGAIYTTLSRLEKKGFVVSEMTEPLPVRGGRSRRLFRITGLGEESLREAQALAQRVWNIGLGVPS